MLSYKVHNKNYWSDVPGNLYINVPEQVLDSQITVLAVLLDGPVKLYRGVGRVIESNLSEALEQRLSVFGCRS